MRLDVGEALLRFVHAGRVPGGNPPQRQVGAVELLESRLAPPQHFGVRRVVHVAFERLDRFPYRPLKMMRSSTSYTVSKSSVADVHDLSEARTASHFHA